MRTGPLSLGHLRVARPLRVTRLLGLIIDNAITVVAKVVTTPTDLVSYALARALARADLYQARLSQSPLPHHRHHLNPVTAVVQHIRLLATSCLPRPPFTDSG